VQRSKSLPKGAAIFMAQCLTSDKRLLDECHGDDTAAELLGVADVGAVKNLAGELGAGGDGRAQVILLALILGALESRTPKDAWRHPGGGWSSYYVPPAQYLRFLAANGYTLSEIETVITGERNADDVYDESLREQDAPEDDG
jgi:ParB family transcriptional regulator, chromosome partitioning protein